jgi:hypothetical protein
LSGVGKLCAALVYACKSNNLCLDSEVDATYAG